MTRWIACLVGLALTALPVPGSAADLFGLGSRNAGLAGAVGPVVADGHAAWYNPAALAALPGGGFSLWYVTMVPEVAAETTNYGSLGRVAAYQRTDQDEHLDLAASQAAVDARVAGAADLDRYSGVGISFAVPIHQIIPALPFALTAGGSTMVPDGGRSLASFSAQSLDQPFFPSWNTPFNQLRLNLGLGAEVWREHLWLGAGLSVHSRVRGDVTTLNPVASYDPDHPEVNPPTASAASTEQSLGLSAAATAGLLYRPAQWGAFSLVYHQEEKTTISLGATATMELDLGEPLRMEVPYVMSGTFAYRPHRIVGGLACTLAHLTVTAEVEFGLWRDFAGNLQILTMRVSGDALNPDETITLDDLGGDFRVAAEAEPPVRLRNTWQPRLGLEYRFDFGLAGRLGYAWRMSPIEIDQRHRNMLLDNDWHTVAAGLGYTFWRASDGPGRVTLDLHFQGLFLTPRDNAVGRSDDGQILAAGTIHTEGTILGGGLELTTEF